MSVHTDIQLNADLILNGIMLVIDPSSGSQKSKTGFAVYDCGECIDSGIVAIDHTKHVSFRLQDTYDFFINNYCNPDLLVIEKIRGPRAHVYLHWAVGVIITAVHARKVIEMNTGLWKSKVSADYVKGDEEDAVEIGKVAIMLAKEHGEDYHD